MKSIFTVFISLLLVSSIFIFAASVDATAMTHSCTTGDLFFVESANNQRTVKLASSNEYSFNQPISHAEFRLSNDARMDAKSISSINFDNLLGDDVGVGSFLVNGIPINIFSSGLGEFNHDVRSISGHFVVSSSFGNLMGDVADDGFYFNLVNGVLNVYVLESGFLNPGDRTYMPEVLKPLNVDAFPAPVAITSSYALAQPSGFDVVLLPLSSNRWGLIVPINRATWSVNNLQVYYDDAASYDPNRPTIERLLPTARLFSGDVDGDGKEELVGILQENNVVKGVVKILPSYVSIGGGGFSWQLHISLLTNLAFNSPSVQDFSRRSVGVVAVGDINNDGRDEIVFYDSIAQGWFMMRLVQGSASLSLPELWLSYRGNPAAAVIGSFDGETQCPNYPPSELSFTCPAQSVIHGDFSCTLHLRGTLEENKVSVFIDGHQVVVAGTPFVVPAQGSSLISLVPQMNHYFSLQVGTKGAVVDKDIAMVTFQSDTIGDKPLDVLANFENVDGSLGSRIGVSSAIVTITPCLTFSSVITASGLLAATARSPGLSAQQLATVARSLLEGFHLTCPGQVAEQQAQVVAPAVVRVEDCSTPVDDDNDGKVNCADVVDCYGQANNVQRNLCVSEPDFVLLVGKNAGYQPASSVKQKNVVYVSGTDACQQEKSTGCLLIQKLVNGVWVNTNPVIACGQNLATAIAAHTMVDTDYYRAQCVPHVVVSPPGGAGAVGGDIAR